MRMSDANNSQIVLVECLAPCLNQHVRFGYPAVHAPLLDMSIEIVKVSQDRSFGRG